MKLHIPEPYHGDKGRTLHGEEVIKAGVAAIEAEKQQTPHCKREGCNNGYRPGRTRE